MENICSDSLDMITSRASLRAIVYYYTLQHPESTKAQIAEQLGLKPLALSRAIASNKEGIGGIDPSLVYEIIKSIDLSEIKRQTNILASIVRKQAFFDREKILKSIYGITNENDTKALIRHGHWFDYLYLDEEGTVEYIEEVLKIGVEGIGIKLHRLLNYAEKLNGSERITIVCYDKEILSKITDHRTLEMLNDRPIGHVVSVKYVDLEQKQLVSESILYDPSQK